MGTTKLKLSRANSLLAKIRYHVDSKLLKTYTAIFESHFWYGCQLWRQIRTQMIDNNGKIQNKVLKGDGNPVYTPLYKKSKIFKLKNIVT